MYDPPLCARDGLQAIGARRLAFLPVQAGMRAEPLPPPADRGRLDNR